MKEILLNIVPAVCLGFLVQLILHEFGHLIGGLLTGWKFIYLQLFHMEIARENKKIKLKKTSTCEFQSIMYPKTLSNNVELYTIGGCILNLTAAFLGFAGMLMMPHTSIILWLYSWSFFAFGMTIFLFNAIPNTKRICNDGACFILLKDRQTRICHNSQLLIAKELFEGKTYRQIDRRLICNSPENTANDILVYQAVLEYYYWLELGEYERMKLALSKISMKSPISRSLSDIIFLENRYADLIYHIYENQSIEENYSFSVDKITDIGKINEHVTQGDVHSIRVNAAFDLYEAVAKGEKEKALNILNETVNTIKSMNCIYSGEAYFCMEQLSKLKNYLFF